MIHGACQSYVCNAVFNVDLNPVRVREIILFASVFFDVIISVVCPRIYRRTFRTAPEYLGNSVRPVSDAYARAALCSVKTYYGNVPPRIAYGFARVDCGKFHFDFKVGRFFIFAGFYVFNVLAFSDNRG